MEYCCHIWAGAPSCYLELLENEKLTSSLRKNKVKKEIVTNLYKKLCTAYVTAAAYIKKKYIISNPLLKSFCALDPKL